jgi:tetratricopeptide (TPR) repeat protein
MNQLLIHDIEMNGANLGADNPLPALRASGHSPSPVKFDENVPPEARKYLGFGCDTGVLPYSIQDGYDRDVRPRKFRVAILENEILRAMFLLDLGGRMWSLIHKPTNRELLFRNPVFQPANLAIRNAWFSGGVEWNIGVHGHTPLTCAPVFAGRIEGPNGESILRMWEWERIRRVPYQMDFWLPSGSPWLFVRVQIVNPNDDAVPMYWWSNIAVPESDDVRVLAPTDHAYNFGYTGAMTRLAIPGESDNTYPVHARGSSDFFYDIPQEQMPWITALDKNGAGLIQASSNNLRGRKLFLWGMGAGGRRWQEFLNTAGQNYVEIQAGLAQTQYECIPMPAKTEWSWVEAYGLMRADAQHVHGRDWKLAREEVESRIANLKDELARRDQVLLKIQDQRPAEILHRGSGWGALERKRRATFPTGMPFDDASLGPEQAPWLSLLEDGVLPETDPKNSPGAWITDESWRKLLEESLPRTGGDHWLSRLDLGVMAYEAGEAEIAEKHWQASRAAKPNAWAIRNLAVLASHRGDAKLAAKLWKEALALKPDLLPLAIECADGMLQASEPQEALRFIESLPATMRNYGRIRMIEARAAVATDDLDRAEKILVSDLVVPDLREGEVGLTDNWYALQEKKLAKSRGVAVGDEIRIEVRKKFPPPKHLDFRMAADAS